MLTLNRSQYSGNPEKELLNVLHRESEKRGLMPAAGDYKIIGTYVENEQRTVELELLKLHDD
jgi:hypothetical protein